MTDANWCIVIAFIMPYILTFISKLGAPGFNNARSRMVMNTQGGWRARTYWAHKNSFEAFAPFAAAVTIAQINNVNQVNVDLFAKSFISFRIAYIFLYINDSDKWRTLAWFGGFLCVISLFLSSAKLLAF